MKVAIVGLGYVGLPLAHAFAVKGHTVIGYDISEERIVGLKRGFDWTNELSAKQLKNAKIAYSTDPNILGQAKVIVMAIPTPVDRKNNPDLTMVKDASKAVGKYMKKGTIVVYESTVYPGVTEDICGPILERASGLMCGRDFTLGYSPERINPGDRKHTVEKIVKVVAGQDESTTDLLCDLYGSVVEAGIHRAPSIKVAEMAKAIENAQRDLNIAYINEVALLCRRIGISTKDVLDAAATKWNFLRYTPGLVGGHCIGVDPYYLVELAKQLKMKTYVISAGRKVNDGMSAVVADDVVRALAPVKRKRKPRVLVLGLTFKEDIPDTRNSKAFDVVKHLTKKGCIVEAHDPFLDKARMKTFGITHGSLSSGPYDAVVLLVTHKQYRKLPVKKLLAAVQEEGVIYDLKAVLNRDLVEASGRTYLAL